MFAAGKAFFQQHADITSAQLYAEVVHLSEQRGWAYGNYHCGHLVGEFPHENFDGDRVDSLIAGDNTKPMRRADPSGRVAHWILEIHLVDPEREIGGFYEQLLTLP